MSCPFLRKPEPCAARQAWTDPAPSDCRACDFRGRLATTPETITSPKEATVPNKMTPKERCLALLARNGSASPSLMMQRCHIASEELKAIVAGEEFKAWPYRMRTGMTAIYTLPGAKDPRTPEMVKGEPPKPEKKAPAAKAGPVAAPAPWDGGAKPAPRPAKAAMNVAGILNIDEMIGFLEEKRSAIDNAIAGLRTLA